MPLPSFIHNLAAQLGFAAVGFAPVGPSRTGAHFKDWLERGFADDMAYLARHAPLRADPRLLMPDARTVIVAAARYPLDRAVTSFAGYCRGLDYHVVLRSRLQQLGQVLADELGDAFRYRICVDSAPLPEREWAVRAGLGWIGRQGCLVHPEYGCALLLAELLVNVELEPTPVLSNCCGVCRKCVEACPTGAVQSDGLVDARRCIACLTIEHSGEILQELRHLMGDAVFGCDRCVAACPYNRADDRAVLPEFRPCFVPPTPGDCLVMDQERFRQVFGQSSVYRSGLARLRRNAAIAAQNVKNMNQC